MIVLFQRNESLDLKKCVCVNSQHIHCAAEITKKRLIVTNDINTSPYGPHKLYLFVYEQT